MSDLASVIEGMDRELDLLEMRPVFESALLTNKAALQIEIQKRLESCRIIEQRRKDFPGAMDAMQQKWAARNISERARPFVAGATNALQDSKSRYDGFFQVRGAEEKAALDYLQFMLGAFGEYEISDTAIYFKNTTNSARYAELTKRIHGIIDEERKLQERYLKFTTEAATRMGKTLNQSVGN